MQPSREGQQIGPFRRRTTDSVPGWIWNPPERVGLRTSGIVLYTVSAFEARLNYPNLTGKIKVLNTEDVSSMAVRKFG